MTPVIPPLPNSSVGNCTDIWFTRTGNKLSLSRRHTHSPSRADLDSVRTRTSLKGDKSKKKKKERFPKATSTLQRGRITTRPRAALTEIRWWRPFFFFLFGGKSVGPLGWGKVCNYRRGSKSLTNEQPSSAPNYNKASEANYWPLIICDLCLWRM